MFKRRLSIVLKILLAVAFLLTGDTLLPVRGNFGITKVQAQQIKRVKKRKKRRTLLEILFGGVRSRPVKKKRRKARKRRKKRSRAAVVAILPKVEKLQDAKIVLVVGDFFAAGLAKGLQRTFSQVPSVKIVSKARGSSGFARLDYYNWSQQIGPLIDELKPSVVLTMIGTNDRQLMRQDGKKLQKRSQEWDAVYKIRVGNFVRAVQEKRVPLVWMGLPPVRIKKANPDFLFYNETYRSTTESIGGKYVDVWDGFTNAEGAFVKSGPDVNGQIVRLRTSDGINVTRAGQNKLAFYAEKSLKKIVGGSVDYLAGLTPQPGATQRVLAPSYDPARTGRSVVIRLDDTAIDGDSVLAGAGKPRAQKVGELIVGKGGDETSSLIRSVAGRADDASWPKRPYSSPAKAAPAPANQQ